MAFRMFVLETNFSIRITFFTKTTCFVVLPPYFCPKQKEESRLEGLQRLLVIINKLEGKKRYVPQRFCHGASFPKPLAGSDKSFVS